MAHALQLLEKLALFAFLVSSMLGAGLRLTLGALITPLRQQRLVLTALGLNFVFAPAFAWLLTRLIPLQHGHAVALLLLGGAAGAPFLPKLAESAHGDLAFAVSLMALLTGGTILFMPLALPFLISGLRAEPWLIARPLLVFIVLPLVLGMVIRRLVKSLAELIAPALTAISNASLILLCLLLVTLNLGVLLGVVGSGAIIAAIVYVAGLFFVTFLLEGNQSPLGNIMALGTSSRNFGAALIPAAVSFEDASITVALIVNAIVGIAFCFVAAGWFRRKSERPSGGLSLPS